MRPCEKRHPRPQTPLPVRDLPRVREHRESLDALHSGTGDERARLPWCTVEQARCGRLDTFEGDKVAKRPREF